MNERVREHRISAYLSVKQKHQNIQNVPLCNCKARVLAFAARLEYVIYVPEIHKITMNYCVFVSIIQIHFEISKISSLFVTWHALQLLMRVVPSISTYFLQPSQHLQSLQVQFSQVVQLQLPQLHFPSQLSSILAADSLIVGGVDSGTWCLVESN